MTSLRELTYPFLPCQFAQYPKNSFDFYALTRGRFSRLI